MKELQIVNTLCESRLFRSKQIASEINVDDAAELVFVYLILLNVYNKEYEYAPFASDYAQRTLNFGNFNTFRTSGTDLYVALNRVLGTDQQYDDPKDKVAHSRIHVSVPILKQFLAHISYNKSDPTFESGVLMRMQRELNIQDSMLRSIRRLAANWDDLSTHEKSLVTTRLRQYLGMRARQSELLPFLNHMRNDQALVVDDSTDEKKSVWSNPIVKVGATAVAGIAAIYAAKRIGRALGKKTSLSQGIPNIDRRFSR
jgi:hypothetical protein